MSEGLVNPTVTVNNVAIHILPESFSFDEGDAERTMRAQASGNNIDMIYTENAETKGSGFKFTLANTSENVKLAREWLKNKNQNLVIATGADGFSRTFRLAAIMNKYEAALNSSGEIPLEWMSQPAV